MTFVLRCAAREDEPGVPGCGERPMFVPGLVCLAQAQACGRADCHLQASIHTHACQHTRVPASTELPQVIRLMSVALSGCTSCAFFLGFLVSLCLLFLHGPPCDPALTLCFAASFSLPRHGCHSDTACRCHCLPLFRSLGLSSSLMSLGLPDSVRPSL